MILLVKISPLGRGLDGELDNEFTQRLLGSAAAQNAISELKLNDSMP